MIDAFAGALSCNLLVLAQKVGSLRALTETTEALPSTSPAPVRSPIDRALSTPRAVKPSPSLHEKNEQRAREVEAPPLDFNPGAITGETSDAEAARRALGLLHKTWSVVHAASKEASLSMSELSDLTAKAVSRGLAAADRTAVALEGQIETLEQRITNLVQPRISDEFAGEIRVFVCHETRDRKGNTDHSKLGKILQEVKRDKRVASALLEAPAMLSGLDEKQMQMVRDTAIDQWAPDTRDELKEVRAAHGRLPSARDRVITTLGPKIAKWTEMDGEAASRLRKLTS